MMEGWRKKVGRGVLSGEVIAADVKEGGIGASVVQVLKLLS